MKENFTGCRTIQSIYYPEKSALAASRGPYDTEEFLVDVEINIVKDCRALAFSRIDFGDVLDFEKGLGGLGHVLDVRKRSIRLGQSVLSLELVPIRLPEQSSPDEPVDR
jgi:hypothetical protein